MFKDASQICSARTVYGDTVTLRRIQVLAGLAISALALYLVLHDVHWDQVSRRIQDANHGLLLLATLILLGTFVVKALRWRLILRRPPGVSVWHLFGSLNVAYFLNNLLPLQAGDIGRGYLVSEIGHLSLTRTLATILLERVLDVLTLLAILLFLALFIDIPSDVRAPSLVLGAVFSSIGLAIVFVARSRSRTIALADRVLRVAPQAARPKLRSMSESAIEGFSSLTDLRVVAGLVAYSIAVWLGTALVVYTGMRAFDLALGYDTALFLVVATTFGFFVPSSPGSFGVYHAIVTAVLVNVWDVDKETAVSFALVIHLVFYLPPMVIGPLFLWLQRGVWQPEAFMAKLRELRGAPAGEPAAH